MTHPAESDSTAETILAVLRRHAIGAFNGSQIACSHCRTWMTNDEYRQHLAEIASRRLDLKADRG